MSPPRKPRPFLCRPTWAKDHPWTTVYAFTRSKARYQYYLDILDCLPDLRITDIDVRSGGTVWLDTEEFLRTAKYRNREDLRVGSRVRVGSSLGWIVGNNSSANFDVIFDEDSEYKGNTLNCHPEYIEKAENAT